MKHELIVRHSGTGEIVRRSDYDHPVVGSAVGHMVGVSDQSADNNLTPFVVEAVYVQLDVNKVGRVQTILVCTPVTSPTGEGRGHLVGNG